MSRKEMTQHDDNGTKILNTKVSSYTSLFDPEDGAELKCVPTMNINGISYAKLEENDVSKTQYWNTVVHCCALRNSPHFEVIDGYIHHLWRHLSIDEVVSVSKGLFLISFNNNEDRNTVISKRLYFFDKKPFIVKHWNENIHIDTTSITSLTIWIQLLALDFK
ncbi:hypothetical protein Cgig2_004564 [Carnegiea gigantea]|uniref:DUF4283 domain-containing protein n=1 Tax=Carnegiea gigantea TaxID=171969 RepID=A0A9Q1GMD9_9CARY|nr:hypothetical protein Cgig2_004564 [Carnegiea gigantea]